MDIASIMSPLPITLSSSNTLDEATELMDAHGVRHLPVVDDGQVVGLVADRDLLAKTGWRAGRDGRAPERVSNEHRQTPIAEVMHPAAVRLTPEDPIGAAARGIAEYRVGCLAIEREGVLIGIVTELDVLDALASSGGEGRTCGSLMTSEMETIAPDATLAEALDLCASEEVHHLPVMEGDALVGMLSDRDLARAVGRETPDDTPISELMTNSPFTVDAGAPAAEGARVMAREKIGALPVLEGTQLRGLLSVTDLLVLAQEELGT